MERVLTVLAKDSSAKEKENKDYETACDGEERESSVYVSRKKSWKGYVC